MLKSGLTMIKLDDSEVKDFLTHLPEDTCREIYDSLSGDEFEKEVKNVNSLFHTINHLFEERFDKDRYLGSCKTHLESNWYYGKPLIEDALARQDYNAAVSYLEKTFEILLSRSGKDAWKPESALMLDYLCFNYKLIHQEVEELLDMWISAEERLENRKKADLLRMQSVTLRNPTDWETVINEYALLRGVEPFPAIDSLFSLWKTEMAKRSAREIKDGQILADSWIGWLIDAKLDNNGECFGEKLEHWLHSLMKDTHKFNKEYPLIELLTHDLNSEKFLESKLVRIFSDVFNRHYGYEELAHHRISALEQYGISRHIPTILSVWRNCASRMVPDPEKMCGYGYTGCAAWMKLLHELNPDEYKRLLSKWKLKHQRRRNLWRDMRSLNLPV